MSNALETLVRLQKAQIDDVRLALSQIAAARAELAARDQDRVNELNSEKALAERVPEDAPAFGVYAARIASERHALAMEDKGLSAQEENLREQMRTAFQELKKIEQLIASQADRERLAENARELAAMDEAAIMRAARSG